MLSRQNEQPLVFSSLKVSQLLLWMSFLLVIASLCFREQVHVLEEHCIKKYFAYFPCVNFLRYPLWYSQVLCCRGLYVTSRLYKILCVFTLYRCSGAGVLKSTLEVWRKPDLNIACHVRGLGRGRVDEGDTKTSHMAAS